MLILSSDDALILGSAAGDGHLCPSMQVSHCGPAAPALSVPRCAWQTMGTSGILVAPSGSELKFHVLSYEDDSPALLLSERD